jgi:ABC-type sugar transport system permease subunit
MQVFMEPYILTNGGPVNSTMTPVLAIYTRAFTNADYGLASAWSVTLMLVLLVISIIYFAVNRANERRRN